jgi:hypothetical protein
VVQYDPYKNVVQDIFEFPGITETGSEHVSGIHWNKYDGLLSIVVDAVPAFLTDGADVSGTYWLLKFDPVEKQLLWQANLTELTQGKWGGFEGVTTDAEGNSYVVGTYPKSIVYVDKTGKTMLPFYPPQTANTTVHGYTGIASTGDTILVVDNQGVPEESSDGNAAIFRFDMRDPLPQPTPVPLTPSTPLGLSDAIYLPPKYGGTVLLVSLDLIGVTVLRSTDGWVTAEQLGTIESDFAIANAQDLPATFQIGQNLFMIGEYFPGTFVPGTTAGNRSDFPFFDITAQVEGLLAK